MIFENVELVKGLMEKAKTSPGLRVTVDILNKVYQTGRKYAKGFKQTMKNRVRRDPSKVELPGGPERLMKSGSY